MSEYLSTIILEAQGNAQLCDNLSLKNTYNLIYVAMRSFNAKKNLNSMPNLIFRRDMKKNHLIALFITFQYIWLFFTKRKPLPLAHLIKQKFQYILIASTNKINQKCIYMVLKRSKFTL